MKPTTALIVLLLSPALARAEAPDPWAGLRFLLGDWVATTGGGKPGEATAGGFSLALDLEGRVAVRRGHAEYAPKPGETRGVRHDDLMVVRPVAAGFQASYWDDEGHFIEYAVQVGPGKATFESAAGAPGPRFRLVYEQRGADEVAITFLVAPPGGAYEPYVSGLARRR